VVAFSALLRDLCFYSWIYYQSLSLSFYERCAVGLSKGVLQFLSDFRRVFIYFRADYLDRENANRNRG
jgi:hypothetical protein